MTINVETIHWCYIVIALLAILLLWCSKGMIGRLVVWGVRDVLKTCQALHRHGALFVGMLLSVPFSYSCVYVICDHYQGCLPPDDWLVLHWQHLLGVLLLVIFGIIVACVRYKDYLNEQVRAFYASLNSDSDIEVCLRRACGPASHAVLPVKLTLRMSTTESDMDKFVEYARRRGFHIWRVGEHIYRAYLYGFSCQLWRFKTLAEGFNGVIELDRLVITLKDGEMSWEVKPEGD